MVSPKLDSNLIIQGRTRDVRDAFALAARLDANHWEIDGQIFSLEEKSLGSWDFLNDYT